jgi:hypothetical protein
MAGFGVLVDLRRREEKKEEGSREKLCCFSFSASGSSSVVWLLVAPKSVSYGQGESKGNHGRTI